ncbi:unnamed protein product, partial [Rotaria socialis]
MALDLAMTSQLAPYDDEEEIQLMDTDLTNLQGEEQFVNTTENVVNEEKQEENNDIDELEKTDDKIPSLLVIE